MIEPMDIYNADKKPTGQCVERAEAFMHDGQYLMYVLAIIQNAEGKFLITQRALDKHWAAGWWEITGGGVRAGEASFDAVLREIGEETGLDPRGCEPELVYTYRNDDPEGGDNYFVDIYHLHLDFAPEDVALVDGEAVAFRLASWEEIAGLASQGIFLHYERLCQALEAEGGDLVARAFCVADDIADIVPRGL